MKATLHIIVNVLSVFMLSFIFVVMCGLFERKRICAGIFVCLYCSLEINKGVRVGILLTCLTPSYFYACPKPGPEFPTPPLVVL